MILNDNLYTIKATETTERGAMFNIELNPYHLIYKAHFPKQPITPGVCIVQIVKELLEIQLGKKLSIKYVKNVKFLSIISPEKSKDISCELTKIQSEDVEGLVKTQAVIFNQAETFAKISIICNVL